MTHFDLVIIGAGIVGESLACSLTNSSLTIGVFDAASEPAKAKKMFALSLQSIHFFKSQALWETLEPHSHPIKMIHISEKGKFGKVRLKASDIDSEQLGCVIPESDINLALEKKLSESSVTCFKSHRLINIEEHANHITLLFATPTGNKIISTRVLIGADGAYSSVRKLMQFGEEVIPATQSALVTLTITEKTNEHKAFERFEKESVIAMLPLTAHQSATIWTDETAVIEHLLTLSDKAFASALQNKFGFYLGQLTTSAPRASYPLLSIRAKKIQSGNTLLIGNAAHTLIPIAAQGLNLALKEVNFLSGLIIQDMNKEQLPNWEKFTAWQHSSSQFSMELSSSLTKLFSSRVTGSVFFRQIGLSLLDTCTPAKRFFLKKALGLETIY